MCPVNHASFVVPDILAAERHNIAFAKPGDSRRQIQVVQDQHRLPGVEFYDKTLMPITLIVVREHPAYNALSLHRNVVQVLFESSG
jgi:hypothetical protein